MNSETPATKNLWLITSIFLTVIISGSFFTTGYWNNIYNPKYDFSKIVIESCFTFISTGLYCGLIGLLVVLATKKIAKLFSKTKSEEKDPHSNNLRHKLIWTAISITAPGIIITGPLVLTLWQDHLRHHAKDSLPMIFDCLTLLFMGTCYIGAISLSVVIIMLTVWQIAITLLKLFNRA